MSLLVTFNGANYILPVTGEIGWGSNLDSYLIAIAAGCLQKTGGNFTLTAETDFGPSFGIKSLYYKSRAALVSHTGNIRLGNADGGIGWRNFLDNNDLILTVNASNQLTFNGNVLETSTGIIELANGSAGTPSLTFATNTTTGLYLNSSNDLRLTVGGTDKAFFRTSDIRFLQPTYLLGPTPWADVVAYGALGDGITNDYAAVQAALTAISAQGGGIVFFPPGTYSIGSPLTVFSNTTLLGASYGSVFIKAKDALNDRLMRNVGSDSFITFENIIFDMNGTNQTDSTAITLGTTSHHTVRNCMFKNPYDSLYLLTGAPNPALNTEILYDNVTFDGTGQVQTTDVVDIGSGSNIHFINSKAFGAKTATGDGLVVFGIISNLTVTNCLFDGMGDGTPVVFVGINGGKVDGCEMRNSYEAGMRVTYWNEFPPSYPLQNFEIVNNNTHDNRFDGIWINHAGDATKIPLNIVISGNSSWNNQQSGIRCLIVDGLVVNNNRIFNNSLAGVGSYYAMNFQAAFAGAPRSVLDIQVYSNHFYDTQLVPTQTKLYGISWVDQLNSYDNLVTEITTFSTQSNSLNIYLFDEFGLPQTASRAMVSSATGIPTTSSVTATELGYVSGVTSAIQTQLNSKSPSANPIFTGIAEFASGSIPAPSITFSDQPDLGFIRQGLNTLSVVANSLEALRIDPSQVQHTDGTVSVPVINFLLDTNTGIYRVGADDIALTTGGIKALEVNSSQQVVIPKTSNQLIFGTTNTTTISATAPASPRIYTVPDVGADATFIMSAGTQILSGTSLFLSDTSNQIRLGTTRTVLLTAPTPATTDRTVTIPDLAGDYSLVGTIGNQSISGIKTFTGAPLIESSVAGAQLRVNIHNTSTSASSDAAIEVQVSDPGAGDPVTEYAITGGQLWTTGIDNSDSDNFKISASSSLGTNDRLVISPAGVVGIPELTVSTVPYTDASHNFVSSAVTPTELGYVSGVTSAIQTQINSKAPTASPTFTGAALFGDGTVSLPGIAFSGDTDLGLYRVGTDSLGISANGVQQAYIDPTGVNTYGINNTFISGYRNRLVNGDMRFDQRNGGALITINNTGLVYDTDGWGGQGQAADGVFTLQQLTATPPTGFLYYISAIVTTADASIGATQSYRIVQRIEGTVIKDFLFGTANAKTVTLSFWVRSSVSGTFSGSLLNSAGNRAFPFEYTIVATNTWEHKSITIPGDTTGTWLTTTGTGIGLNISLGAGSSRTAAAGSWTAALVTGATGAVDLIATNGANLDLTGVQLEIGSVASNFEYLSEREEQLVCERYYEKTYALDTAPATNTTTNQAAITHVQTNTTTVNGWVAFRVPKRVAATVTFYTAGGTSGSLTYISTGAVATDRAATVANNGTKGFEVTQTAALDYLARGHWTATAEL